MSIADWVQKQRKRRAIGRYLDRLGPALVKLYGKAKHYRPAQVLAAVKAANLRREDVCYGLSVYCTAEDFDDYHAAEGETCSYWEMRVEVAEHCFHGNTSFTQQDVMTHTEAHSHSGGDFGGHHGGDFGGHHSGHHSGHDGGGHF